MTTLKQHSMEERGFNTEPGPIFLKELEVRPAEPGEMERVRELLDKDHYLGSGRDVGRTLAEPSSRSKPAWSPTSPSPLFVSSAP